MIHRKKTITRFDIVVLLLAAAAVAFLAARVKLSVHYDWNWGAMPQYLFRYDAADGRWVPNVLVSGLLTTIRLSFWATILATVIGTAVGLLRVSNRPFNRLVGGSYVETIRNLPPLVLIFIFYYFIGDQLLPALGVERLLASAPQESRSVLNWLFAPPGLLLPFLSALITLGVFEGAYIAEIVRAGVQSIEKGQWEAADSIGLNRYQRMRLVVIPQALRRILPPLAGQFIATIKDSAIVSVISIQELTFQGMELMAATYLTFETWITITVLYLVLTLSCSLAVERLEIRLGRHRT